jgi:radical SAM protein with 4Fe4S-binding SPASM domain
MSITAKIDNITHLKKEYRNQICPAPPSVKIELSRACNFNCKFCSNSKLTGAKGHMESSLYERIVEELYDLGVKEIGVFYFGESFLNPNLADAIQFTKKAGIDYVFLTTNGSFAFPKNVAACMDAGLDSLKFSLNYSDEKQFSEITGVNEKQFFTIKENIKDAYKVRKKGGYDCGLYASYIMYDGEQQERMIDIVEELKPYLDEVYSLPLYSQAAKITNDNWKFSAGNRGRQENMVEPLPCWALFQEAHVNFDGTLNACCFAVDDTFIMGDLREQGFMEAWNSLKFQALRKANLEKHVVGTACENCVCGKNSF